MGCLAAESAMMLALCYPFLISVAMAAPGISRSCYNYCKSLQFEPITEAAPLTCNCADFIDTETESKELSMITFEDTGVYFVPADMNLLRGQFAFQPFYISNPAKLVPKTRSSRINREFTESKDSFNDLMPSQSEYAEIYERTISHTSINQKLANYPLYLDLEIGKSAENERSAIQKSAFIEDFESTEQAVMECFDLQVLNFTRKYGLIKEFEEIWEVRNLNKYEKFSNTDIDDRIQKYCRETEAIVQQSLQDIKKGMPKKMPISRSDHETEENVSTIPGGMNATLFSEFVNVAGNITSVITSTSQYDNTTVISEIYNIGTETNTMTQTITEIPKTTYDPIENWPFIDLTPSSVDQENIYNKYQNSNPSAETRSDQTVITTENTLIVDIPGEPIVVDHQSTDTMTSEDVFHSVSATKTAKAKTIAESQALNSSKSLLPILTTPLSTEESLGREGATTEIFFLDDKTVNKKYPSSYHTSHISVTGAHSQVFRTRNLYPAKEIIIPKITTKECRNNTVQTTIDGIEELPNNDFTNYTALQSEDFETANVNRNTTFDYLLTGKLYFISNKNELVPVRFIQTDTDGALSLGIDGAALCDKLVHESNKKSSLIATLCNHIQIEKYQNKNSTIP